MPARPSNLPAGAKLWLLNLGQLDVDASEVLIGANIFPAHLPAQVHERRRLIMIAGLLYHPALNGLVLFDTGSCEDALKNWPAKSLECGPRIWSKGENGLPEAIKATGAGTIEDVKVVVLSHLHLDHAGGLEWFFGRKDVEIWCHEEELKHAFWSRATGMEPSLYLPEYLTPDKLNWKTFNTTTFSLLQGVTLHLCPGHTSGSIIMELELVESGTVIFTGDLFHVKENYEEGRWQGILIRDFNAWHRSRLFVRNLVEVKNAKVLLGHEASYFEKFAKSPEFTE